MITIQFLDYMKNIGNNNFHNFIIHLNYKKCFFTAVTSGEQFYFVTTLY